MTEFSVSVIMPAFNAEAFIGEALASVLSQTFSDLEIIVVDDCSTDNTMAIVSQMAELDGRIKCVRNEKNAGPSSSRNAGIRAARGKWIALLDADDEYTVERIDRLMAVAMANPDASVISDNVMIRYPDGFQSLEPRSHNEHVLTLSEFISGCKASRINKGRAGLSFLKPIIKRHFLSKNSISYQEHIRNGEDLLLYIECLVKGAKWVAIPEAMYLYRVIDGSLVENNSWESQLWVIDYVRGLKIGMQKGSSDDYNALRLFLSYLRSVLYYNHTREEVLAWRFMSAISFMKNDKIAPYLILREILSRAPSLLGKVVSGSRLRTY